MKKGQIFEGVIERVDFPNKGIVYIREEDRHVTVKNGIPGQKVRFIINKFKRGNAEGRLLEVLEKSPLETREPVCSIFPACGGCMYQTMPYEEQMKMKEGQIRRLMDEAVRGDYIFEGVKASPKEFGYRNKMEFSFGDEYKDGPLSLGLHKKGSTYDVLTAGDCRLVHEDMNKILLCVLEYFRERNVSYYKKMQHTGYLRHLLLRRGDTTGEILVNLVTTTQEEHDLAPLADRLLELELEGKIVGILHILNDSLSDVVKSDETRILYGQDFFYEKLLGLDFKITPFSFFQPNTRGAEVLYETVREYIGDIRDLTVFDLFSGTGTISQVLAPVAKEVVGVEIVEEAVEAARENAARNGIFFAPIFLYVGIYLKSSLKTFSSKKYLTGTVVFYIALLLEEGLALLCGMIHDLTSMYLMLVPLVYFLVGLLLQVQSAPSRMGKFLRQSSLLIYVSHILFAVPLLALYPNHHLLVYLLTVIGSQLFSLFIIAASNRIRWLSVLY